ncbi:MAG: hypothetical protein H0X41_01235 [Chitinophagaceae bacterium]|nr:hypothetical protein [Chitinophagaceae bacterium]
MVVSFFTDVVVVSIILEAVSTGAAEALVSTVAGATVVVESVDVLVFSVLSLQAVAKAPIANTKRSFFIVTCFKI